MGGTFDPPHFGHLVAAQDVADALDLDGVHFEVAARSPLKPDQRPAPGEARLAMLEAAIASDPRFRVGTGELERGGPSYTIDTIRALGAADPVAEWFLIIGVDQLERFREWREPEELARLSTLVVVDRSGTGAHVVAPGDLDVPFESIPVTRMDVSSSQVRDRVRAGRSIRYLVPEAVRRIIEERGLYGGVRGDAPRQ